MVPVVKGRARESGRDQIDAELETLLRKLSKIELQVGVRSDKKENARPKSGDAFTDLKDSIVDRLQEVRSGMQEAASNPSSNPREQIELDSRIKRGLRDLRGDWHDLDRLLQNETRSKKSTVSQEVLRSREVNVLNLLREIDDLQADHRSGYAPSGAPRPALSSKDSCELFRRVDDSEKGIVTRDQETVTGAQQRQIQALKERDQDFDKQINDIGRGIEALEDIARAQNEEVKKQGVMIDDLGQHLDQVHEHLDNVNKKMKVTLDKVGRSSDKLCVDIMCLILLIGMAIVIYKLMVG